MTVQEQCCLCVQRFGTLPVRFAMRQGTPRYLESLKKAELDSWAKVSSGSKKASAGRFWISGAHWALQEYQA